MVNTYSNSDTSLALDLSNILENSDEGVDVNVSIDVTQINLHKAKLANEGLGNVNSTIFCVQEPYVFNDRFNYVPSSLTAIYKRDVMARAGILVRKGTSIWFADELSSRDVCVGILVSKDKDIIMVVSAYFDQLAKDPVPEALLGVLNLVKESRTRIKLVICADTNAHSTLWGSDTTDHKGEALELLVMEHDLIVQNTGHTPTFSGRGETFIDVTFTKGIDALEWHVSDECSFSDHFYIKFKLQLAAQSTCIERLSAPDWSKFSKHMDTFQPTIPDVLSTT